MFIWKKEINTNISMNMRWLLVNANILVSFRNSKRKLSATFLANVCVCVYMWWNVQFFEYYIEINFTWYIFRSLENGVWNLICTGRNDSQEKKKWCKKKNACKDWTTITTSTPMRYRFVVWPVENESKQNGEW